MAIPATLYTDQSKRMDITARVGDSLEFKVLFKLSGAPEDISASTFAGKVIRIGDTTKTAVYTFVINMPDVNRIRIYDAALPLKAGRYFYDIQRTWPSGKTRTRLHGFLTINNDAT